MLWRRHADCAADGAAGAVDVAIMARQRWRMKNVIGKMAGRRKKSHARYVTK